MGLSSLKGSSNHHVQRGKPYALMLLLAFGAAILGVMVLHKLREKRIFNLLVQEKDHELLSLHLLFQREKEFNKEARKKIEEMKTKMYSLRSQKLELDRRLLEMESTIASLRDERKVMESALEEKKIEIKMLTGQQQGNSSSSGFLPQVASLKKTENEYLKHHPNSTSVRTQEDGENHTNLRQNSDHGSQTETTAQRESRSARSAETESVASSGTQEDLNSKEDVENGGTLIGSDEKLGNQTVSESQSNQALKTMEYDKRKQSMEVSDSAIANQDQESQGYRASFHRGGLKLENSEGSDSDHVSGSRLRRRHPKGKRWRDIIRKRRLGHSLYSVTNGAKTKKEVPIEDQFVTSDKVNHTQETGSENAKPKVVSFGEEAKSANVEDDAQKQKSDEITMNGQSEVREETEKEEKTNGVDVEHEDGEEETGEREAAATEDSSEDAETREPEIDKADIQRFSESDHEDEAEETEF